MRKSKLSQYELTGSIHTLSIKTAGSIDNIDPEVGKCLNSVTSRTKDDKTNTYLTINPNKLVGDAMSFSEFETAFDTVLAGAGVRDYLVTRADMRYDSYDPKHYLNFSKLNRYLLSCVAVTYQIRNSYLTKDLFDQKQISIAVKNDYFELENYDRSKKNEVTSDTDEPAQSRLEARSVSRQWRKLNKNAPDQMELIDRWNIEALRNEFTKNWFDRWDKAISNLDAVQARYNDELVQLYRQGKDARPCRFRTMTDFVIQYEGCIFTRKQLVDLFRRLGANGPENKAKNHIYKYGLETISKSDLQAAVGEIKKATLGFFDS